jgi:hypothetical protein
MLPVYRIRDGIENVKKNDVVFEKTLQVLLNRNNPLAIFPEGNHGNRRRLRQLVKGLFRIAFQAQEKYGNEPGIKIVPIGVDYGHYQHFRTTLFVNIGEPIEVSELSEEYRKNPVLAINRMKDRFTAALSKQMIDIQTEDYYDLYMNLREIFNQEMCRNLGIQGNTLAGKFRADKVMIDELNRELEANPDNIRQLDVLVKEYQSGLKKARLRDWVLGREKYTWAELVLSSLIKLAVLPVFIFGFVNNYLPYWFAGGRTKNIKDPQFHSSFKFVIGMIAFPVWYLFIAGILVFTSLLLWLKLLYIILLPVTGLFAFHYFIRMKKFMAESRFCLCKKNRKIQDLLNLRKDILSRMHEIVKLQNPTHENPR